MFKTSRYISPIDPSRFNRSITDTNYTVDELRKLLYERGVQNISRKKKGELTFLLLKNTPIFSRTELDFYISSFTRKRELIFEASKKGFFKNKKSELIRILVKEYIDSLKLQKNTKNIKVEVCSFELANEIYLNIFLHCDLESIGKINQVCQNFHKIVSSSYFWKIRSELDFSLLLNSREEYISNALIKKFNPIFIAWSNPKQQKDCLVRLFEKINREGRTDENLIYFRSLCNRMKEEDLLKADPKISDLALIYYIVDKVLLKYNFEDSENLKQLKIKNLINFNLKPQSFYKIFSKFE